MSNFQGRNTPVSVPRRIIFVFLVKKLFVIFETFRTINRLINYHTRMAKLLMMEGLNNVG